MEHALLTVCSFSANLPNDFVSEADTYMSGGRSRTHGMVEHEHGLDIRLLQKRRLLRKERRFSWEWRWRGELSARVYLYIATEDTVEVRYGWWAEKSGSQRSLTAVQLTWTGVQLWGRPSMVSLPRMPAEGCDPVRPLAGPQVPTMSGSYVCQPGGGASRSLDASHPPAKGQGRPGGQPAGAIPSAAQGHACPHLRAAKARGLAS